MATGGQIKGWLAAIAGAALAAALLAGCGWGRGGVRIGALGPGSGPLAAIGTSARRGYDLALEEWNQRGGVLGKRVTLVPADDAGDPATAARAVDRLVRKDHVCAVVGSLPSAVTLTGASLAQAARVPMVVTAATQAEVTALGDCIFRACFTNAEQGRAAARFARKDLGAGRAVCLASPGSEVANQLAAAFAAAFAAEATVAGVHPLPEADAALRALVGQVLAERPDVVYLPDALPQSLRAASLLRAQGYRGPLLGSDAWDGPGIQAREDALLEDACFTTHFAKDDPDPVVQAFVGRYRQRFKAEPDAFAALGYDAMDLVLRAVSTAGRTDKDALREALRRTRFRAVTGPLAFNAQGDPQDKAVAVLQIRSGVAVLRARIQP